MFAHNLHEGLELRLLELRHAQPLYAVIDRHRDCLREWLPWVEASQSSDDVETFIRGALQQYAGNKGMQCGIFVDGRIVGCIGFQPIDWANRKTSIGYWLAPEYQGRGVMTSACRALLDYAFQELQLNRIGIRAAVQNAKSRAIPERLGFEQEGILRSEQRLSDRYVDIVVYGMLAIEWSGRADRDRAE